MAFVNAQSLLLCEQETANSLRCTKIMLKPIILVAFFAIATAEYQSYHPRGWRPAGLPFEPAHRESLQQTYGGPPLSHKSYGSPISRPAYHPLPTTTTTTTTTTTEAPTTTTPTSREPTTSPGLEDQDFDSNPALAIANSFAFNRPVYVYNAFPFHPGLTFVK